MKMGGYTMSEIDRAYLAAARAYDRGDYDLYEELIAQGAAKWGMTCEQFEDNVTDTRLFGVGCCG